MKYTDAGHHPECLWFRNKARGIPAYDCNCGAHSRAKEQAMTSPTPPAREKLVTHITIAWPLRAGGQWLIDANDIWIGHCFDGKRTDQVVERCNSNDALLAALPDAEVCDWIERQRYDAMMDNAGSLAHRRWEAVSALVAALRAARGDGK